MAGHLGGDWDCLLNFRNVPNVSQNDLSLTHHECVFAMKLDCLQLDGLSGRVSEFN